MEDLHDSPESPSVSSNGQGLAALSTAKERPILFSGPMVRALLAGTKTQTRRAVKGEKPGQPLDWLNAGFTPRFVAEPENRLCPYGTPGDRLWVRESGLHKRGPLFELFIHDATTGRYWASPDHGGARLGPDARGRAGAGFSAAITRDHHKDMGFKARPSIHMPRWASRITLEITDVRVERLQDISPADAIAEGIRRAENDFGNGPSYCDYGMGDQDDTAEWFASPIDSYQSLWNAINGPGSWNANPWVWVVEFRRASERLGEPQGNSGTPTNTSTHTGDQPL